MSSGSLTVKCPFCGRASRMPPGVSGRVVRCPHCQQTWKLTGELQQVQATGHHGQTQQTGATNVKPTAGTLPTEKGLSDLLSDLPRDQGATLSPEIGVHPSMVMGSAIANPPSAGPASSIWWFILGGLSVLVLLGVVAAVVVVVVLFLQKTPQQARLPQPPAIVAEPATSTPDPAEELNRKGAATAAFLEALFDESRKVLGDFSNPSNLFVGGAPAPGDLDRKMAAWEQVLSQLNTKDVDPVAIQFKDNYAREFRKFLGVMIKMSQNVNAASQSGNPDAVLNLAEQLAAAQNESLKATNDFFDFLNTEGQAVKKDLESRYHRPFPMPSLPR